MNIRDFFVILLEEIVVFHNKTIAETTAII